MSDGPMDGMGLFIVGHRSSKSTSGANNGERKEGKYLDKENLLSAVKMKKKKGKKENIWRRKMSFFLEEKEKIFVAEEQKKREVKGGKWENIMEKEKLLWMGARTDGWTGLGGYTGCPKKTHFQNAFGASVSWLNQKLPAIHVS